MTPFRNIQNNMANMRKEIRSVTKNFKTISIKIV